MKPVRTEHTSLTFKLAGGTEENDLPAEVMHDGGSPVFCTTWELTEAEKDEICMGGKRIQLLVWGRSHPPVALRIEE